nr:uncharacterized protein LOC109189555 [Ipomoea batatas]
MKTLNAGVVDAEADPISVAVNRGVVHIIVKHNVHALALRKKRAVKWRTRKMGQSDLRIHTITKKEDMAEHIIERLELAVELEEVEIDPTHPKRRARIGKGLSKEVKELVAEVLRKYRKIFAWDLKIC